MSLTYTQLVTAVQDNLENYETTFTTHIDDFIRETEQEVYTLYQLPVARKTATTALSLGVRTLATPADFLAPYEFAVVDGTGVYTYLINKDPGWIREAFPDPTTTGLPQYYALLDATTFIFSQIPDANYATELHYYYYPTSLATLGGSNTTWLSTNFESVMLYGCLVRGYGYMKGDPDLMQFYDVKYKEALAALGVYSGKSAQDAYKQNPSRLRFGGATKTGVTNG